MKIPVVLLLPMSVAATAAGPAPAPAPAAAQAARQCERLAKAPLPNRATITLARHDTTTAARPARCVVKGRIVSSPASTINFRVDLPAPASWNSKILMLGGGGFDGSIPTDADGPQGGFAQRMGLTPQQIASFVLGSTDSGHQGRGMAALDYSWSAHNPTAIVNHAYQANHLVLGVMVDLTKAFYGKPAARRYLVGGSNGARQGLIAAQRYPEDYDGILAFAPAISQNAFAANLTPVFRHIFASPDNWLSAKKVARFLAAQVSACDELDGLKDGVIDNYQGCRYDPGELVCKGADSDDCLTPGQLQSIWLILGEKRVDVPMADGLIGYTTYGRGGAASELASFFFGSSFPARDALDFVLADNIVRHALTDNPNASVMTYEPERFAGRYFELSQLIDATNPDLSGFHRHGGKIIVLHGTADYCVTHERAAQYFRSVESRLGKDVTRSFFRFFVAPDVGHGLEGPGANSFEVFAALQGWVEQGRSPDGLVATRREGGTGAVQFVRPLCDYGSYPRYLGSGDPKAAGSFACSAY